MANDEAATITRKMGSVLTQTLVRDMLGSSRSGRRERRGPEPSRGGGTSGRTMRVGEISVEACRRNMRDVGIEVRVEVYLERRMDDGRTSMGRGWVCMVRLVAADSRD